MSLRFTPDDLPLSLGYAFNPLDRMSDQRADTDWIDTLWRAPEARFVVLAGDKVVLSPTSGGGATALLSVADAATYDVGPRAKSAHHAPVFLGLQGAQPTPETRADIGGRIPHFACLSPHDPVELEAAGHVISDLRSLVSAGLVPSAEAGAVAHARSLFNWHLSHPFCSKCGARTMLSHGGYRRDCPQCQAQHFPRTDPVVIMAITHGDRVLLGRQARFPPGMYSCLAGFLEPGETIEDAVRRETWEEAGVRVGRVAYHSSQPWPFPNSLMIGCVGEALSEAIVPDQNELEDCRWFTRDEAIAMLAGTHAGGVTSPKPIAIAHHLLKAFIDPA